MSFEPRAGRVSPRQGFCNTLIKFKIKMTEDRLEDRGKRTDDRGQRTEDRGQRTVDRGQRTVDRGQRKELINRREDIR